MTYQAAGARLRWYPEGAALSLIILNWDILRR
jgi:hypothetical protein